MGSSKSTSDAIERKIHWGVLLVYGLFCLLVTIASVFSFAAAGDGVADFFSHVFDKDFVGSGLGFTRWMLIDSWTGSVLLAYTLITSCGTKRTSRVLFFAMLVVAYLPGVWLHLTPRFCNDILGLTLVFLSFLGFLSLSDNVFKK